MGYLSYSSKTSGFSDQSGQDSDQQAVKMANQEILRWATSAAAVSLWAPAMLVLLGSIRVQAERERLGLVDHAAMPSLVELGAEGLTLFYLPVLLLALLYLLLWLVLCLQEKKFVSLPPAKDVPILPLLAATTFFSMSFSFTFISDGTPEILRGSEVTVLGAAVVICSALVVTFMLLLPFSKNIVAKIFVGDSFTGIIFTILVIVASLSGMAWLDGTAQGNDIAWGCVESPGVQLEGEIPGMDNNTTYILITHAGGFYYVRDPALNNGTREAIAVPETLVHRAVHSYVEASRNC